jgi:glycerophosphoryl diester phosphodiesterase
MKFIAHRGASGYCPENTLSAFQQALSMGAQALELDVQQTKDGELVVVHDADLKRVAGVLLKVGQSSYKDICDLDVGSWFHPRFSVERLPRLAQVLEFVSQGVELHLEIKQSRPTFSDIETRILGLVEYLGSHKRRIVISSFHHPTLRRLRQLDRKIRLGYLVGKTLWFKALREAVVLNCESIHVALRQASLSRVRQSHARGLKFLVYTVNTRRELAHVQGLGVDGVFTNYPDLEFENGKQKDSTADISRANL